MSPPLSPPGRVSRSRQVLVSNILCCVCQSVLVAGASTVPSAGSLVRAKAGPAGAQLWAILLVLTKVYCPHARSEICLAAIVTQRACPFSAAVAYAQTGKQYRIWWSDPVEARRTYRSGLAVPERVPDLHS